MYTDWPLTSVSQDNYRHRCRVVVANITQICTSKSSNIFLVDSSYYTVSVLVCALVLFSATPAKVPTHQDLRRDFGETTDFKTSAALSVFVNLYRAVPRCLLLCLRTAFA